MDWKDVRYLYDKDGTVSDVRYVPLSEAEASIKELEEKLELYMEAHGNMVVLNDSYAERGAQLKKEIEHLEDSKEMLIKACEQYVETIKHLEAEIKERDEMVEALQSQEHVCAECGKEKDQGDPTSQDMVKAQEKLSKSYKGASE